MNPSISLGLAEGAFDETVNYVRGRQLFGNALSDSQGVRWKLADMYKDIEAGRGLLYRACATADPFPDPFLAAAAKIFCNEMSIRVTSEAVQLHGGYGFTDEYLVSRLYRGARYGSLGGGASETLRDLIGRKIVTDLDVDGIAGPERRPRRDRRIAMLLVESDGKALLTLMRHCVPEGTVVAAGETPTLSGAGPWIVKAQVPVGGRGKAGGVIRCDSAAAVSATLKRLFGISIKGHLGPSLPGRTRGNRRPRRICR